MPRELYWFWWAYWELDSCRHWTEGMPVQIPWTVIKEFAEHYKFDFEYLHSIIRKIDGAYLDYRTKKRQKDMDDPKSKSKRKRK